MRRLAIPGLAGLCVVLCGAALTVGGCGKKAEAPAATSPDELSDGPELAGDDDLEANEPEEESPAHLDELEQGDELGDDEGATE